MSIYQLLTCYFALSGNLCLFNAMLQLRYGLESIRRKNIKLEKMNIVCCTDSNYIMPCGVLLCSICENNTQGDVCFHIIINKNVSIKEKESLIGIVNRYKMKSLSMK